MSDHTLSVLDHVATVTLNRPRRKNALSFPLIDALVPELEALAGRDDVRALVLTGAGGSFCSGADLKENAQAVLAGEEARRAGIAAFHRLLLAVWQIPFPTLAVVDGDAVGFGMDLALACDLRLCSQRARFCHSFSRIALVPDGGSSLTLSRLVGAAKAAELTLLSEFVSGEEAARIGLVNRVLPEDELGAAAADWAARLAAGPPLAHRLAKANWRAGLGVSMEDALARELDAQLTCLGSEDLMTGVSAWMQGTTPVFVGR